MKTRAFSLSAFRFIGPMSIGLGLVIALSFGDLARASTGGSSGIATPSADEWDYSYDDWDTDKANAPTDRPKSQKDSEESPNDFSQDSSYSPAKTFDEEPKNQIRFRLVREGTKTSGRRPPPQYKRQR